MYSFRISSLRMRHIMTFISRKCTPLTNTMIVLLRLASHSHILYVIPRSWLFNYELKQCCGFSLKLSLYCYNKTLSWRKIHVLKHSLEDTVPSWEKKERKHLWCHNHGILIMQTEWIAKDSEKSGGLYIMKILIRHLPLGNEGVCGKPNTIIVISVEIRT